MQALAIVVRLIELDLLRFGNGPEILDLEMAETPEFRAHSAEHGIVRVAGVTGAIARNAIVLEVARRQVARIIHIETAAEVGHHVAGEAELSGFRAVHLLRKTTPHC